ncbi:putative oxidoreductase [Talaromyces proteolyticus]|uniref:Oxidoreductase n=1 Tax=Talaromyces proteolyticus TaxID=1131652 RepID=A0AAD4KQD3_9EURO|nr:putative oxidoreductase [Talaromyces proteolyticus]KAH8697972.1 putative oxidoreductase [Talaromyces proteolyticus]
MNSNKALIFKNVPHGYPIPGKDLTIEPISYNVESPIPQKGILVQSLYASFDPYMRGRMRVSQKSYTHHFELNKPIDSFGIAKVLRSSNSAYKEGDLVIGQLPIQEYVIVDETAITKIRLLENPLGIEDIRVFLGALGMPGLTAYSSFYKIGKPQKGETIFISAASGAVGQIVGQLAKHEGLTVIGSVGSDEKLEYITNILNFDSGFNYKKEKPADALARLAPQGLDIYYENVGGEHLEAAINAMNDFGRIVCCGMISESNSPPYPITNIHNLISKRLEMRGFIVFDPGFADVYSQEHQRNLQSWIKEGSFKTLTHETVGIDHAAEGLVGIFQGKNMGKAVLKF